MYDPGEDTPEVLDLFLRLQLTKLTASAYAWPRLERLVGIYRRGGPVRWIALDGSEPAGRLADLVEVVHASSHDALRLSGFTFVDARACRDHGFGFLDRCLALGAEEVLATVIVAGRREPETA
jgi:hypothetical protein